jgi:hypothetical protein
MLTTLLLLTPPVILAANMVRMEAPLFLLIALVVLLHTHGYSLAAGSLPVSSLLFHPALGVAAIGYVVIVWIAAATTKTVPARSVATWEWIVFAVVAISISAELFRIVHHGSLFRAHMLYQARHKLRSPLRAKVIKPQGLILLICLWSVHELQPR